MQFFNDSALFSNLASEKNLKTWIIFRMATNNIVITQTLVIKYVSASQPFLLRGTLSQL